MSTDSWAILTDVTRCIGCERCVEGCRTTNGTGRDAPWRWVDDPHALTASRWTTVERVVEDGKDRYVRRQCRHCVDPACASVCPVGALRKTEEGPVVYDATICMGCRYCMMACPYKVPRYEWESATPRVRKCILCRDKIRSGELDQPACTAACPVEATIFGERTALLEEAHERIRRHPGRYIPRVFGETEIGGTSVLYLSDVDLSLPPRFDDDPLPERTWAALRFVPPIFVGVGAAAMGLRWLIGRRMELRGDAVSAPPDAPEDAAPGAPDEPGKEEER
jgi:formate dehydrogenase iron-sulfur subunit